MFDEHFKNISMAVLSKYDGRTVLRQTIATRAGGTVEGVAHPYLPYI